MNPGPNSGDAFDREIASDGLNAITWFKTKILVVVLCDMQITSPKQFSPKTTPSGY
jgi:hypothetical protein